MSTSSARAATIFDLVIGFAIESFLHESVDACASPSAERAAILHGDERRLSTEFPRGARSRAGSDLSAARGRRRSGGSALRLVAEEEDRLAGLHEPELLAGQALDGPGVRLEGGDLRGQAAVLLPELRDLAGQGLRALPLREQVQDAAVAEEGPDHEGDERDD